MTENTDEQSVSPSAAPHPTNRRWDGRTTAVAAAVAVGIGVFGGGAMAYAAPKINAATQGEGGRGGMGHMRSRFGEGMSGMPGWGRFGEGMPGWGGQNQQQMPNQQGSGQQGGQNQQQMPNQQGGGWGGRHHRGSNQQMPNQQMPNQQMPNQQGGGQAQQGGQPLPPGLQAQ